MGTVYTVLSLSIDIILYLALFLFMLRMLFQLFKADSRNQFVTSIAQLSNYVVLPMRQYIPKTRYIDLSTFLCWLIIDIVRFTITVYAHTGSFFSALDYLVYIPADFAMQFLTILFYSTLFYSVINFVAPGLQSYGMDTLKVLCEPTLNIIRKQIPPTAGFDFAPLIVLLFSKCIQIGIMTFLEPAYFY